MGRHKVGDQQADGEHKQFARPQTAKKRLHDPTGYPVPSRRCWLKNSIIRSQHCLAYAA